MTVKTPKAVASIALGDDGSVRDVESWSIRRELTGGGLPAQARGASGFSAASGSIDVRMEDSSTPWRAHLKPGGVASIDAAADHADGLSRVGLLQVREISADGALTRRRHISLEERLDGLRRPLTFVQQVFPQWQAPLGVLATDAAWVIDQAARAGGYFATPPPVASCVGSVPMMGSLVPEVGTALGFNSSAETGWVTLNGRIAAGGGLYPPNPEVALTRPLDLNQTVFGILDVSQAYASVYLRTPGILQATASSGQLQISGFGTTASIPHPAPAPPPGGWARVQFEFRFSGVTTSTFTGFGARVRYSVTGPWSGWVDVSGAALPLGSEPWSAGGYAGAPVSGFQIHTADDPVAWRAPNAKIAASGVMLDVITTSSSSSGWHVAQDVAAATMGAVWIDEDGVFTYRNRDPLRGSATPAETIIARDSLADVPWSISRDDVADRIEVTYEPMTIQTSGDYGTKVWESPKIISLRPGHLVQHVVLDGAATTLDPAPRQSSTYPSDMGSPASFTHTVFDVNTAADGTGTRIFGAVDVETEMIGPSTLKVSVHNRHSGRIWLVTPAGDPALIVRAGVVATPAGRVTIGSGLPRNAAANPLTVDLGAFVQRDLDAQSILAWLESVTANPLPVLRDVRVLPNPARRLGDVAILRDDITGISAKVLVSGKVDSMSAGALEQYLTLTVLDVIFDDLDRAFQLLTFDQLDVLFAGMEFDDIDTYMSGLGGTL